MGRKRRIEITVEKERTVVVRRRGRLVQGWCAGCAEQVRMVTPEEAAVATRVSSRTIYRWAEDGKIHFTETPEGFLRICLNSLVRDRPS